MRKTVGNFEGEINPIDLYEICFVNSIKSNSRITRQDGNFIVVGLLDDVDGLANKVNQNRYSVGSQKKRFIIPSGSKKNILKNLAIMGIHEATIYPEMEYRAKYLKDKYMNF